MHQMTPGWPSVRDSIYKTIQSIYVFIDQRVTFLREKARRNRWREEVKLLESEIIWTRLFFANQSAEWRVRADDATGLGYREYARRMVDLWEGLEQGARDAAN